jgi:hypothetical protein
MGIRSWFSRKKKTKEEPYARLVVEVNRAGMQVKCGWVRPDVPEEIQELVQGFGTALMFLQHGKIFSQVLQTIATTGALIKDEEFARAVMVFLNDGERYFATKGSGKDDDEPYDGPDNQTVVVRPAAALRE